MSCYHPLKAYRSLEVHPTTGKRGITFNATKALVEGSLFKLPCGQCMGCRVDRSREWAIRCAHEAKMCELSCFITLTYDNENVPQDYSVKKRDWQLFMKRLRKAGGAGIRFQGIGEYSDAPALRPHYHAVVFNWDFPDKKFWRETDGGHRTYKSEMLDELWPFGLHELGSVTPQSAGYVSRYSLKKITGDRADDHYSRVSPMDGQVYRVEPEFVTRSLKPGLGSAWFDRFASDAFPSDFLIVDGRPVKPPAYYLRKLSEDRQAPIKRARKRASVQPTAKANATAERLRVREQVHEARMKRLVRTLR